MIRRLTAQDKDTILDFLYEEPEINLYIIGDIENYGFNTKNLTFYGEFKDGKPVAVMSKNMSNITFYTSEKTFNEAWIDVFNDVGFLFISCKTSFMPAIKKHYPEMREDVMDFMKSTTFKRDESIDYSGLKILKDEQDAKNVLDLIKTIPELYTVHAKGDDEAIKYFLRNSNENGTTVFYEIDGIVAATASAVYETKKSAMIVAVATHDDHRQKGLGKKVMHYLMDLYVNQKHKTLCLYYDDPRAEKLYKKLNFVDIDRWSMLVPDDETTAYWVRNTYLKAIKPSWS